MIKEAYVSYEVAKLLKEKGFDEPCRSYFISDSDEYRKCTVNITSKNCISGQILRPTHQMACAWLREVHGIHVSAIPCAKPQRIIVWQQNIINLKPIKEGGMFLQLEPHRKDYNSYEEAVEAALKYVLENLI